MEQIRGFLVVLILFSRDSPVLCTYVCPNKSLVYVEVRNHLLVDAARAILEAHTAFMAGGKVLHALIKSCEGLFRRLKEKSIGHTHVHASLVVQRLHDALRASDRPEEIVW